MNEDVFEEHLRRQPWRPLPKAWRKEIITGALTPPRSAARSRTAPPRWLEVMDYLLWPSPRAWAGVAALWLAALAGNLVQHGAASAPGPSESLAITRQHETLPQRQRILAEWLNSIESAPPPPSQAPMPPRGDVRAATNRLG